MGTKDTSSVSSVSAFIVRSVVGAPADAGTPIITTLKVDEGEKTGGGTDGGGAPIADRIGPRHPPSTVPRTLSA